MRDTRALGSQSTPTLRTVVRSTTRDVHEQLERRLSLDRGDWTVETYAAFLRATLAVVSRCEPAIAELLRGHLPMTDGTTATARLLDDLQALGAADAAPSNPRVPSIANAAEAFGAAYVLEGSRLGGQVIAAALTERLGLGPQHLTYLCPPGVPVGPRWRAFVESLDRYGDAIGEPAWDAVTRTASDMFASFSDAFTREGVLDGERAGRSHQL